MAKIRLPDITINVYDQKAADLAVDVLRLSWAQNIDNYFKTAAYLKVIDPLLELYANEVKQYIIDRIFDGKPASPGKKVVDKPSKIRRTLRAPRPITMWEPLKDHRFWKYMNDRDGRILVELGHYARSIQAGKEKGQWVIGIVDGDRPFDPLRPTGFKTNTQIFITHEFGSRRAKIPARPHWRMDPAILQRWSKNIGNQMAELVTQDMIAKKVFGH